VFISGGRLERLFRHRPREHRPLALVLCISLLLSMLANTVIVYASANSIDTAAPTLFLASQDQYDALHQQILAGGGHILHAFPKSAIIATCDQDLADALLQMGLARYATRQSVPDEIAQELSEAARMAVAAWEALLQPEPSISNGPEDVPASDALVAEDLSSLHALDLDPALYQQSEYLIGSVAVNVVLVESNGAVDPSSEDWTPTERQQVFQKIVAALNWWQSMEPRAHLQFVYHDNYSIPVPTSYEPITRPHTDERLWISEAMNYLGYSHSSYITSVRAFNRDIRQQYGTDWAFTVFVVDSSNDLDNRFADGYFAYAYIFGPFLVVTSGSDGYGLDNLDAVLAHEVGHIFGALDTYADANVPASVLGGYLGVPNGNSEIGGVTDEPCIMRGGVYPYREHRLSFYSAGQVGWWDSDGDGILDPVDTSASLQAQIISNDQEAVSLAGVATDIPFDSPTRNDITINRIEQVRYRVNGGMWRAISASDGNYDSAQEAWEIRLPAAPRGTWEIEVQTINTAGNSATKKLTIHSDSSLEAPYVQVECQVPENEPHQNPVALHGTAVASAEAGPIIAINYQLDTGPWQPIAPSDGRYDQESEDFLIELDNVESGTHTIAVRAWAESPWAVPQTWESSLTIQSPEEQLPDEASTQEPSEQSADKATNLFLPVVAVSRN